MSTLLRVSVRRVDEDEGLARRGVREGRADHLAVDVALCSTFNETMMALLTSSESTATSHLDLADKLTSQVADALREKERRKEVIRSRVSSPVHRHAYRRRRPNS